MTPELEGADRLDRFVLVRCLGRGGMGVVYEALDPLRGSRIAIKTLRKVDPAQIHRIKQEFRSLAGIVHPNLVTLHELFARSGEWFFTMELVEGVDFLAWVRPSDGPAEDALADEEPITVRDAGRPAPTETAGPAFAAPQTTITGALQDRPVVLRPAPGRCDLERLRPALAQLALGMQAIHRAGRVHRDLKPSNVRVTPSGTLKILDFGLVTEVIGQASDELAGTTAYMAPEQAAGAGVSPATDWYALGVMIFEALSGHRPFTGSRLKVLVEKQTLDAPPLRDLAPEAPGDLADLAAGLLARDPGARPAGDRILRVLGAEAPPPALISAPDGPFVGRDAELAVLDRAMGEASTGRTVAVLLQGPSGIGKSALIQRFAGAAGRAGVSTLSGRCYEQESLPFKGLDAVIDSLTVQLLGLDAAERDALLPPEVGALARLFPVLKRIAAVRDAADKMRAPADARERLRAASDALAALLHRFAERRPLLLWLDDLQWSDADGTQLLVDLLGSRPPLLFVGSLRSDDPTTSTLIARLRHRAALGGWRLEELAVGPLSIEEAGRLAAALADPGAPGAEDRAQQIARESGGIPFFVHELAHHSAQKQHTPSPHPRPADADPTRELIRLDHALIQRIGRLSPEERRIVEAVAVAGHPIEENLCVAASGVLPDAAQLAIAKLRAAHLIRTKNTSGRAALEPYHDRVGRAATQLLDAAAVAEIHRNIARALEAVCGEPELLTLHYRRGADDARAAEHALRGAERAREALAFDRAASLYQTALEIAPQGGDRAAIRVGLADSLAHAGRVLEAAEAYLDAGLTSRGDAAIHLRSKAAEMFLAGGYLDRGLAELDSALKLAGLRLPLGGGGALAFLVRRRAKLRLLGIAPRSPPRPLSDAERVRIDLCWSATAGLAMVDMIRAAVFHTEGLERAARAGDHKRYARALGCEAVLLAILGGKRLAKAERTLSEAAALSAGLDDPHLEGLIAMARGYCAMGAGGWAQMLEHGTVAELVLSSSVVGARWELNMSRTLQLWALCTLGRLDELHRRLEPLIREADRASDRYALVLLRGSQQTNVAWLAADDVELAQRQLDEANTLWSNDRFSLQHWWQMATRAQIALYQGDAARAWRTVEETWGPLTKSGFMRVQNVRLHALQYRARTALAFAAATGRRGPLAEAQRIIERLGAEHAAWGRAYGAQYAAVLSSVRGDAAATAERADKAAAQLEALGMRLEAASCRRLAGQAIGGDAGADRIRQADATLGACGVRRPDRFAQMLNGR